MAPSMMAPRMPMFPPGAPGIGQQLFYGQPPPAIISPQVLLCAYIIIIIFYYYCYLFLIFFDFRLDSVTSSSWYLE